MYWHSVPGFGFRTSHVPRDAARKRRVRVGLGVGNDSTEDLLLVHSGGRQLVGQKLPLGSEGLGLCGIGPAQSRHERDGLEPDGEVAVLVGGHDHDVHGLRRVQQLMEREVPRAAHLESSVGASVDPPERDLLAVPAFRHGLMAGLSGDQHGPRGWDAGRVAQNPRPQGGPGVEDRVVAADRQRGGAEILVRGHLRGLRGRCGGWLGLSDAGDASGDGGAD